MLPAALLVASACTGRRPEGDAHAPAPPPEPARIGIMTGSEGQDGESYRAAQEIARRYPRRVMHITYPDNFPAESVTVAAQLAGLAGESNVSSIVIGQAIPGIAAAARSIRDARADLVFGFVTARDDPDSIGAECELAIGPDEIERGRTIVAAAWEMGGRSLVYYSFPRHLAEPLLAGQRNLMRSECTRRGMKFTAVAVTDPAGAPGLADARKFVANDVPHQLERGGPTTAFYTTYDGLQEPLIRALLEARQGYLVEQALPGPAVGYPDAFDLEQPDSEEPDSLHAALRQKVGTLGMRGHFGTWPASVQGVAMRAVSSLLLDARDHGANPRDSATVRRYLEREAHAPVHMRRARVGVDQWLILMDHVTY